MIFILLFLQGCGALSESFDSGPGQGVGAKSISEVNAMVDEGHFTESSRAITPIISVGSASDNILLSDQTVVKRLPEQHKRIWLAPFQDNMGNFYEAAIVHTLIRPSTWQLTKRGEA